MLHRCSRFGSCEVKEWSVAVMDLAEAPLSERTKCCSAWEVAVSLELLLFLSVTLYRSMDLTNYVVVVECQYLGIFELADHPGQCNVGQVIVAIRSSYIGVDTSLKSQLGINNQIQWSHSRNHVCFSIFGSFCSFGLNQMVGAYGFLFSSKPKA